MSAGKIVVDLKEQCLNFDGQPIFEDKPQADWNWCLRQLFLAQATEGPAVKFVLWCLALTEGKPLELDRPDFDELRKVVENSRHSAMLKGNLLIRLDKAKDQATKAE